MNRVTLSVDGRHAEGWNNGNRCITAAVAVYGIHEAVAKCADYLREWGGEYPEIAKDAKAAMDASDIRLSELAFGGKYR